jgi:uroporphyrinogen-III decarboxylase
VRQAIATAAPGGRFILGTADSMRPETPPENVQAYFDAAAEFGSAP